MSAPIRLGGLTSGFDTESIIKQLLAVEQSKIDNLQIDKETNLAKIDTWEDLADQLQDFGAVLKQLKSDIATTLFTGKAVSSTLDTVATATASASAIKGNYKIVVSAPAQAHVAYSGQKTSTWTLGVSGNVIINGATIPLAAGDSLADIATKINAGSFTSGQEINAMVIDKQLTLQTKETGASKTIHGTVAGAPPFVNGTDDPAGILQTELGFITGGGNIANEAQTSLDAAFTVNGVPASSESNTVTGAIPNTTLSILTAGTTILTTSVDTDPIKEKVLEFVNLYNDIRTWIDTVRNAKLDDEEQFGMFFSDSMMRGIYNEMRRLSTGGVRMGGAEWDGAVNVKTAAATGATSLALQSYTSPTGTLKVGDMFTIAGDTTIYRLTSDASKAGNEATVSIDPPLNAAVSGNEVITLATRTIEDLGIGVRSDSVRATEGILGILDEGLLDSTLSGDLELIQRIFGRGDSTGPEISKGVATRLWDWVDVYTKVGTTTTLVRGRLIDNVKVTGLKTRNTDLEKQMERLEARMAQKETLLIRRFANMENAMAKAQAAGQAVMSLNGSGQQ